MNFRSKEIDVFFNFAKESSILNKLYLKAKLTLLLVSFPYSSFNLYAFFVLFKSSFLLTGSICKKILKIANSYFKPLFKYLKIIFDLVKTNDTLTGNQTHTNALRFFIHLAPNYYLLKLTASSY